MQTLHNDHPIKMWLAVPAVDRTRRNHGLEHATLTMLARRNPQLRLVGRSTAAGFYLYGNVSTEAVQVRWPKPSSTCRTARPSWPSTRTAAPTLSSLASRPPAPPTSVSSAPITGASVGAGCPWWPSFPPWPSWPRQPVGLAVQRDITTSGDMRDLAVTRIERNQTGAFVTHFVGTEG